MPERGFDSGFWDDPFIQALPREAKFLYVYLWTNSHCNQAGLYEITVKTIAFETDLPEDTIPAILDNLQPKVQWYAADNLIWVKNFIKRQTKSPKFLVAVAKCLNLIHSNGAIKELLDYNLKRYTISIPYPYHTDTLPIPSDLVCSDLDNNSIKGGGEGKEANLSKITKLYESNIGLISPVAAEMLKEISDNFSSEWFEEATKEAIKANARNLKYILAVLERWKAQGFKSQAGDTAKGAGKQHSRGDTEKDKYTGGKYGHMVQR